MTPIVTMTPLSGPSLSGSEERSNTRPVAHSVSVKLPASCCNNVKGLCGRFNPALQFSDVYTTANGTVGWYPSTRWGGPFGGAFQSEFVESWRVAPGSADALFTEVECPTGNPVIPIDPPELFADCPEKEAEAKASCPQGRFYESCMTDFGVTCDRAWVAHCDRSKTDYDTDIDNGDIDTPENPGVPPNSQLATSFRASREGTLFSLLPTSE